MKIDKLTVSSIISPLPGIIGLYIKDLGSGECIALHEKYPICAASVIKLPVMAAAFEAAEKGHLDLHERITVKKEQKMPSCGVLTYMEDGTVVTVMDLITLMIIVSDNTAANIMIDRIGMSQINRFLYEHGMADSRMRRKLFDEEKAAMGFQNTVSAYDIGMMLERILCGGLVSESCDTLMLQILSDQRLNGKMPFYLHDKGIRCAHKTGEDDGITHDVGIIFSETPRVFCFLSEGTVVPEAEKAIQRLAMLVAE